MQHAHLHLDKSWQVLTRHRNGHHVTATKLHQGPGISVHIKIPHTGILAKTSAVTEATWDNYINHDGRVSRSNPFCGSSTYRRKVRGFKTAALSLTSLSIALIKWPRVITITEISQQKKWIDIPVWLAPWRKKTEQSTTEEMEGWIQLSYKSETCSSWWCSRGITTQNSNTDILPFTL